MGQLVLSEDAIIELDGEEIIVEKGSLIQVDNDFSTFRVDEDFEIVTGDGKILVESGDFIQFGGDLELSSPAVFISEGNQFEIEPGDKFDIIEEGTWDDIKGLAKEKWAERKRNKIIEKIRAPLAKFSSDVKTKTRVWLGKKLQESGYSNDDIKKMISGAQEPPISTPYDNVLASREFEVVEDIIDGSLSIESQKIIGEVGVDGVLNRIHTELVEIGDKDLAKNIDKMLANGIFGKIDLFLKRLANQEQNGLTSRSSESKAEEPEPKVEKAETPQKVISLLAKYLKDVTGSNKLSHENLLKFQRDKGISYDEIIGAIKWYKKRRFAKAQEKKAETKQPTEKTEELKAEPVEKIGAGI